MARPCRSTSPETLRGRRTAVARLLGLAGGLLADGLLAGGLLAISLAVVGPVGAASPSVSPGPSQSGEPRRMMGISAWLDAPLPADAPAGSTIDVGVTIVDVGTDGRARLSRAVPSYLILSPATGDAPASRVSTRSDWPGHVRAAVPVPVGGPGPVQVGFEGQECRDDGTCQNVDVPFADGGVGPPPDVPRAELVTALLYPPAEPAIAGRPLTLEVEVTPRGAWDPATLGLPDRVIAIVNEPRGPDVVTADLLRRGAPGGPYTGSITIPLAGAYAISIAFPGAQGREDQVLSGATAGLTVEAAAAVPVGLVAGGPPESAAWPWVVGLVIVMVVAGYVIKRVFADL